MLTIAYLTNRKQPMVEWFFDSLHLQTEGDYSGIKLVVIDFWAQEVDDWTEADVVKRKAEFIAKAYCPIVHVPPKPTVWQGKYRRAKLNYFAASNTRNTALCLAEDGYLAFVDDLAVLLPGWLEEVRTAQPDRILLGSFNKVLNLEVEKGVVKNWQDYPPGRDPRYRDVPGKDPIRTGGGHMFGCSLCLPVKALLEINGFDEDCDSMSGEDYIAGIMLERRGYQLFYCRRMATLESEERHFIEKAFPRIIKIQPGSAYRDSSHAILDWVVTGQRLSAPNYQNMEETRKHVLAGESFPVIRCPEHDWRDGQLICEMDQVR